MFLLLIATLSLTDAVTLNGSSEFAVTGSNFSLICDVPEEATLVQFYRRRPDLNYDIVGIIQVHDDQCLNANSAPVPCASNVCSCVPSGDISTVFRWIIQPQMGDHGSVWFCSRTNLNIPNQILDSDDYTLKIADGPGNSISLFPPDITYTRTEGNTLLDITCTAVCRPDCTYVWTRPDNTTFTPSSVLSLGQLDRSEQGMYKCTARNVAGESFISINLTIKYRPYVVISPSTNPLILEEGQTGVALQCAVTLTNPPVSSMVWTRGSTVVSRTGTYSLPPVNPGHAGIYTCTANNSAGTSTANITLEVVLLPKVSELLGITNVSSSSVTLKWLPSEEAVSSNTLSIEYACVECDDMGSIPVDREGHREFQLTTLTDLLSWTQYTVNLTSTNKLGTRVSAGLVVATAPQPTECITAVPSGQEAATPSTSVALVAVGVVLIVIGIISLGTAFVIYRKGRLLPRPSLQQDRVKTPVTFSDIIHSENDEQPNRTEDGTQYQELNLNDIGAPSHYDSTTAAEADNIDANRTQYQELNLSYIGAPSHYDSTTAAGADNIDANRTQHQELNLNDIGAPSHYDSTTAAGADNIDANRMGNDGVSPYANITQGM
ncbi:uncharacterized protein [Argopecten irradians]|uniref:uncharacterized protein isoform X8 n=1 Tax=Argopecten irradians TaxID=31199 RepID=UPI00371D1ACE